MVQEMRSDFKSCLLPLRYVTRNCFVELLALIKSIDLSDSVPQLLFRAILSSSYTHPALQCWMPLGNIGYAEIPSKSYRPISWVLWRKLFRLRVVPPWT